MKTRSLRANDLSKKRSAAVMTRKRKLTKMLLKPAKLKVKKKVTILMTTER